MKSEVLRQTLSYLENLPADSDVWDNDVPAFLSSMTALSQEKATERASAISKEQLTNAIREFQKGYTQLLEYFELDTSEWSPPDRSEEVIIAEITGMLESIAGLFEEYSAIPEKGSSLSQTRHLNNQREDLENRIPRLKSDLDQFLKHGEISGDPPPKPGPDANDDDQSLESEASKRSSDATLSDLQLSEGLLEFDPTVMEYEVEFDDSVENHGTVAGPEPSWRYCRGNGWGPRQ